MKLKFVFTLPETAPLIENYDEVFGEAHQYEFTTEFSALPRIGEAVSSNFVHQFLDGKVAKKDLLSTMWHVRNIVWEKEAADWCPVLFLVGN